MTARGLTAAEEAIAIGDGPSANGLSVVVADALTDAVITVPNGTFLSDAQYIRDGNDLILAKPDGTTVAVRNYFTADPRPDLTSEDGTRAMNADLVESFVLPMAPGQYAQLGAAPSSPPIGQVAELTGRAFAVRADGTRVELGTGDPLFQGDVVETGDGDSAIRMLLADQTTFSLSSDARIALDDLTFDPQTQAGNLSVSILKGVFIFTSGQVAKTDPSQMTVNTPVATIGIRGTVVTGKLDELGGQFTILDGAINVVTNEGSVQLSEAGATTQVTNINAPPSTIFVLTPNEYAAIYKAVSTIAPGSFLLPRRRETDERDSSDSLGADAPTDEGSSSARGSVGQNGTQLLGAGVAGLGAFALLNQNPNLAAQLQALLGENTDGGPAELSDVPGDDDPIETTTTTPTPTGPVVFDFSSASGPVNFVGNDSDEIVIGSAFGDTIDTRGGNDTVAAGPGGDTVLGGAGDDVLTGDSVTGGAAIAHTFVTTEEIPDLADGATIDPAARNGVDLADLTLAADNPVTVTFQGEGAGFQNSIGYYTVGPDGTLGDVEFIWTNASEVGSGGDLTVGDTATLDVGAGDTFSFFIIADGFGENDFASFGSGSFEFRGPDGEPATIDTVNPQLFFVSDDGVTETELGGDVFHSSATNLNSDGVQHAVSGIDGETGELVIGFEDLLGGGDNDFEDVLISVDIAPAPTGSDDTLIGGAGNDTLTSSGGSDVLLGGDGNDLIRVSDLSFERIDGGAGTDTLAFTGPGASFDLGGLTPGQVASIEEIDLSAIADATLTLDAAIVLDVTDGVNALTGTADTLVVTGDAGDELDAGAGWTESGDTAIAGESYTLYEHSSGAQLAVDDDVTFT